MNPVSLTLDLLLAVLLLVSLGFGLKLDKRLKALSASQANFAAAVADLDQAAARAEIGLADLRTAMDEAVDLLAGRIEKARELAAKLETLTAQGAAVGQRAASAAAAAGAASRRPTPERDWAKPARTAPPPDCRAEAAAEALALTLTRKDAVQPRRSPPPAAPSPRSRALVDDELFDGPAFRRLAGGRS